MKTTLLLLSILFLLVGVAYGIVCERVTITAENTFTSQVLIPSGTRFNLSIRNISSSIMTIKLMKRYTDASASGWGEADSWDLTAASVDIENISRVPEPEPVYYKIGCPTGGYTSGTSKVRLGFE